MNQFLSDSSVRELARIIVGRPNSFLNDSIQGEHTHLEHAYAGRRVLILGAGGFIARQTLRAILPFRPAYVGLVDISENGLAEVVRSVRSSDAVHSGTTVEPWLADIGSAVFPRVMHAVGGVDRVLNFAAVKHVRSERDVPSLLRMLEVNILATHRATAQISETQPNAEQFVVSTDKAADPASFMGASKRAMELVAVDACPSVSTARFANVAFSSGSLLESWLRRISDRLPVAVPRDTWRYFVTPEEAGQLCILASVAPRASVVIPNFATDRLVELEQALTLVLRACGYEPEHVSDVASGISALRHPLDQTDPGYPIIVTDRDTPGEKRAEQFLGAGERAEPWVDGLGYFPIQGEDLSSLPMASFVEQIEEFVMDPTVPVGLDDLRQLLEQAIPTFRHIRAASRLDDRA